MEKYDQKYNDQSVKSIPDIKELLTLKDFIKGFNEKNKENLTETTVRAMKHAIEVRNWKNFKLEKLHGFNSNKTEIQNTYFRYILSTRL